MQWENMRRIAFVFLLFSVTAYADDLSDTSGELMDVSYFRGTTWGPLCPYGQYHDPDGNCINNDYQSPQCPDIETNNTTYATHVVNANVSSFLYHEASGNCRGAYIEYTYNPNLIQPVESGGDFLYAASFSGALCPYGQYHLDGVCYPLDKTSQFGCDAGSHMTVATDASFMGPKKEKPRCNGDYYLYDFVTGTDSASLDDSKIYPLYNGTLLVWGAKIHVTKDMTGTECTVNGNEYYQMGIINDTPFKFPSLGMCDVGFSKFVVEKNCHHITNQNDIDANWICGVLCDSADYVYTNSGVCSVDGYCMNGDSQMRLHVARPDGEKYSYPLYASKTSSPSMHFKFVNTAGNEQTCYVNLVPPQAIDHFVGEKPNPIRVGKSLSWTDSSGKTHTTTNLITID